MGIETIPERDAEGYLKNLEDWSPAVAEEIARQEGLELTPEHWELIHFLRDMYQEFGVIPPMRVLVKAIGQKLSPEKGNSIYLMKLFTGTPVRLASKIAGLPKPSNCL